jgi:hypothetical protein
MFAEVRARPSRSPDAATAPSPADAARAVLRLEEMATDLRGCAILDRGGHVLAASGDEKRWRDAAGPLLAAADGARGESAEQVHVATEDGEVFAVRHRGLALVAVTERFTLASLMMWDMRMVLRELAGEVGPA